MHPTDPFARANALVAKGQARWYRGRLIPIMAGGSGEDESPFAGSPFSEFADIPQDLSTVEGDALAGLITDLEAAIASVTGDPLSYATTDFTIEQLLDTTKLAVAALKDLKAEASARAGESSEELSDEQAEAFASLSNEADDAEDADADAAPESGDADADAEADADAGDGDAGAGDAGDSAAASDAAAGEGDAPSGDAAIVAAAPRPAAPRRRPLPAPTRDRAVAEHQSQERNVSLVAAGGAPDMAVGTRYGSSLEIAEAMVRRHAAFGQSGPGTVEKFSIAKANWKTEYGRDRMLTKSLEDNLDLIEAVTNPANIRMAFEARKKAQLNDQSLVASGGLCAPVTPYYNLQFISSPVRPVMGSLPSFVADRGGLNYARPAALSAVTDAIGIITAEEDEAGGSSATKSCQVIPCPPFQETDVDIIYHCLQFGNLGARAFPELVAQWNNLVLAAHARLAESNLLTNIDAFSTQVTAGHLGLGASATLFSQILAAANGMRNRNRMNPDAVLRLMLPWWAVDLIVSDVIRTQFQRFDTDQAKVIALLRSFNIEPTFYIDGANGRNQVFGTQSDGALLPFPEDVVWYLFPEGSFIYLDGGTLELGIVRDSVLNRTNDFQIFGETFENVAFVGVEALAVASTVCDSGTVSQPTPVACPTDYSGS